MNTLQLLRIRKPATEASKILYNMSPDYIHDLVNFKNTNYSFRYRVNTEMYGRKSFRYQTGHIWSCLPNKMRASTDFREFGKLVQTWSAPRVDVLCVS